MTTIYWNTIKQNPGADGYPGSLDAMTMAYFEPESVLKYLVSNRDTSNEAQFTKCPAFLDYVKNMYVIRSPIDIKLSINHETGFLHISPQGQEFYDKFILHRGNSIGKGDPLIVSINLYHLFIADEECLVESLPVMFHEDSLVSKIRHIPGTFDISKWYRPVEPAFEIINMHEPVSIKRGAPLFYVRFVPKNGKKVKLVKKEFSKETLEFYVRCVTFKQVLPKQPLKALYEIAKNFIKPVKKCPFNWRNK